MNTANGAVGATGKSAAYLVRTLAVLLLLFLYSGYCLQALPVVAPSLLEEWQVPARDLATPLALISIGMALGAMIGGSLGDAVGRRLPIIGFAALEGLAVLLSSFVTDFTGLYILVFFNGLGLGGYFASGMALITEITSHNRRGLMISLAMLAGPLGINLCSLLASFVMPTQGWSAMFLIGGLAAIPLVAGLAWLLPESPTFLAKKPGRAAERQKLLALLGLPDEALAAAPPGAGKARHGGLAALLRDQFAATILLWIVFFVMYVLGSVVLGWMPVVFNSVGFDVAFSARSLFYWTLGSMVGTPFSGWCIGRLGSRQTCMLFTAFSMLALAVFAFADLGPATGWLVMILLPLTGFSVAGVVTTLYALAADTYPAEVRGSGIGFADAIGRAGGIAGAYAGVFALESAGASGFFAAILVMAAITFAMLILLGMVGQRGEVAAQDLPA